MAFTVLHVYCQGSHEPDEPCPRVAAQAAPLLDATWTGVVQIWAVQREGGEPAEPVHRRR